MDWQARVTAVGGSGFASEARKMNITTRLRKVAVERMLEECKWNEAQSNKRSLERIN